MGLDHLLGRPSPTWKRIEVLLISYFAIRWLKSNNKQPPTYLRGFNHLMSKLIAD